jgi:hypothetical protein
MKVSRTIGDMEAKLTKFGGNPKCVISDPDIVALKIKDSHDFIILASQIYDFFFQNFIIY